MLDEPAQLVSVKRHEAVYLVHAAVAGVRRKACHADFGAAKEDAEELVEVGEKLAVFKN